MFTYFQKNKKRMRKLYFLNMLLIAALCFFSVKMKAADIASGTSGTCSWVISEDGILTISPSSGTSGVLGSWYYEKSPWNSYASNVVKTKFVGNIKAVQCHEFFDGFVNMKGIEGLTNLNTDDVSDMAYMFNGCSSLESLDLSGFNTEKVTSMESMFNGCSSLEELDLSSFDTPKVKFMIYMFSGCSSLKSLDLSMFQSQNLQAVYSMFFGCSSLEELDVSGLKDANLTSLRYTFAECSSLKSLDLSMLGTANVTDMYAAFTSCSSLKSLNLSHFDIGNVVEMGIAFNDCPALESIYLPNDGNASKWDGLLAQRGNASALPICTIYCPKGQKLSIEGGLTTCLGSDYPYSLSDYRYRLAGDIDDENTVIPEWEYDLGELRYIRKNCNEWGTVILPWKIAKTDGFDFYDPESVVNSSNAHLKVKEADVINENKPYVFHYGKAIGKGLVFTNSEVKNISSTNYPVPVDVALGSTSVKLKGTYSTKVVRESNSPSVCYYIKDNAFWHSTGKLTVPVFRAWLEDENGSSNPAKMLTIVVDNENGTTGLSHAFAIEDECESMIFNLQGQRISSLMKGQINIVNGKKVLVR